MTALVQSLSRFAHAEIMQARILKALAMFCGAVLFVSVLRMTYGLDLSPGFF